MVTIVILSTEPPEILKEQLEKQTFRDFEVIYAREKGIVNAMNIALSKAKGDIFVRIDDDVALPPQWLQELIRPFSDPAVAGVTAPTFVPKKLQDNRDSIKAMKNPNWFLRWMFDGRPYARAKIYKCGSVSYGSNFGHLMENNYDIDHLEGTNWAMRTALIRAVGGFDPAFDGVAEWFDTDVEYKVRELSPDLKFVYAPNAWLYHLLWKNKHYDERFSEGWSRIANWIRFHRRHSRFHYKKIIWFTMLFGYIIWAKFQPKGEKNGRA